MRIEFPPIRQQLEDYQHALLKHGTAEQILRPVDSRMARRMGYTLEGLKAAIASKERALSFQSRKS